MKIPTFVRITSKVRYEVLFVDRFDQEDRAGECRFETKQIVLLKGLSQKERLETFLHELLHAVEFEHEVDISHKAIYQLEKGLAKVLFLNKWVRR